jgi:hypothetical protein
MADKQFAFRTFNGSYVCAENGGGTNVVADRPAIGKWEVFTVVQLRPVSRWWWARLFGGRHPLPDDYVAIRAANGQYLSAMDGGSLTEGEGGNITADRDQIGDWETFRMQWSSKPGDTDFGGTFTLMSASYSYVCAENGGGDGVAANRSSDGPWETFHTVQPPYPL